jgi:AGZA family xanthine/uracil permease-like MFS transporter
VLPRAREALLADAIGTVGGAVLGTSTVTAYIESATGVAAGGRTGLANLATAALFLLSLLFYPLVRMIGGGYHTAQGITLYPVIAPALILVGTFMMKEVSRIPWEEMTEAIPAFLTIIIMPLSFSVTDGIAFGFISYALLKLVAGRGRDVHWILYLFAVLFVLRYALGR